ncbi:MAG: sulfatase [Bacteroidales bacterium]|nr:sulfatase [Bacteroidales bacterium]
MKIKTIVKTAGVCAVSVACSKTAPQRPNIIVIMTDDHTCQAMSCYGSELVQTPNLDRLAAEGMRMDACYVPNAISGPSRACILTGKYSHVNGFTDNSRTFDGSQQTFPKLLHEAGYQTAMIGKWHLNSEPQGFDYWSILEGQGEYYSPLFIENGTKVIEDGYVTDVITDKALSFLDEADPSKPFMMLYYHKAPHRDWMPAQRHLGMNEDKVYPEPATLLDDYKGRGRAAAEQEMMIARHMWPDWDLKLMKPSELLEDEADSALLAKTGNANVDDVSRANKAGNGARQFRNAFNRMNEQEKQRWNEAYAPRIKEWEAVKDSLDGDGLTRWKYQQYMKDYCAVVTALDENVGRLLDYLEEKGQLDNTIIIYTSDQGFFLGEHGWFDKRFMYEECQRTPMLVRYPSAIKAGSTSKALAMNIDIAPTLLDYAGVDVPSDIQGLSLRPVLESKGKAPKGWRDAVYYHYYEYPSWHSVKRHYGIRTERYKLIHFYNDVDEWELYDMLSDPYELHSVYDDPAYADVREDMHERLTALQKQVGDTDPDEKNSEFFQGADAL